MTLLWGHKWSYWWRRRRSLRYNLHHPIDIKRIKTAANPNMMRWKSLGRGGDLQISSYTRAMGFGSQPWCCLRFAASFSAVMLCRHGNTQWSFSACFTHLHVVRGRLVAGSLKSLRHVSKDLHRRQQVARIKVPPLGEVKKVFGDLGHPIPREHPLALSKVPLNLQKQERTGLGAWEWNTRNDSYNFRANQVCRIQERGRDLNQAMM